MKLDDAEEYTQALGQVMGGAWRQIAWGERNGVPQALGLTTRQWVNERLGGYVRLSIEERREAAKELTDEGMSQRAVADVLGVAQSTVNADQNRSPDGIDEPASNGTPDRNRSPDPEPKPEPLDPAEVERARDEKERQQAIARQVNRLRNLIDGWDTVTHLRTNPLRDEVLDSIGEFDRDLILKIEEAIS